MKTEKISRMVLYGLIAVSVIVFGLFFMVGFNRPWTGNPSYNAPLLTDVVLALMLMLVVGTIGVTIWAVSTALKKRGANSGWDNNVPTRRIALTVGVSVLLLLGVSFLAGSSATMLVNGKPYDDSFWLKTADMFIVASLGLLLAAIAAVIYGATRYYRRRKS